MRLTRLLGAAVAVVLMSAALAMPAWAAVQTVTIQSFSFMPPAVTINAGDSVSWTNKDQVQHTATSDTGAFDTGAIAPLGGKTITFTVAGTYAYHCTFHSFMKGTVTVRGPAPTTAPPPPPTPQPTPRPTLPPTAPPTVGPTPSPSPSLAPTASPSAAPSSAPSVSPVALPSPVAAASPLAAPSAGPDAGGGPGPLLAAAALVFAAVLAGVALTLYRRR
ncbi:MAG TPA: cupredoxin family copper-binding protein [Candidatus Limnocylindria bacterium]|nr:cupredoxin family copper-binding protein [Candidatus Limnocylindria bacterium]